MKYVKRLNYYRSQFLLEEDFLAEQAYHRDMRLRLNQAFLDWGVAEGLDVKQTENQKRSVSISPGLAIDRKGQEIVLLDPEPYPLQNPTPNATLFLTIEYAEKEAKSKEDDDFDPDTGKSKRVTEKPLIQDKSEKPADDGSVILLAAISLDANGDIRNNGIDNGKRKLAGMKLADHQVGFSKLRTQKVAESTTTLTTSKPERFPVSKFSVNDPRFKTIFVDAYSTQNGAKFEWTQSSETANGEVQRYVQFTNRGTSTIEIKYVIYEIEM